MRKAIREAMGDSRPWLEVVEELQAKGISLNLILAEANAYGIKKQSSPDSSEPTSAAADNGHAPDLVIGPSKSQHESTCDPSGRAGVGDSPQK